MPALTLEQISKHQERLRAEIRHKQELLKAYDLVAKDLEQNGQPTLFDDTTTTPITARTRYRRVAPVHTGYGSKTRLVRYAIDHMRKPFTIKDLYSFLSANNMELSLISITTVLNRLRFGEAPYIEVRHQGKGRRATVFQKTGAPP
jgi:hypothetical protein